ncbi:MAG TPA: kelch repeat-containing protein [Planctomycetota bacterium]|nr:kelch repeat-containing protein [Planctomycetota bacterium]
MPRGLLTSLALLLVATGAAPSGAGAEPSLPDKLAGAPANTWVMLDVGGYGGRNSAGLVYLPEEGAFLVLGGNLGKGGPYSEVTLNLKESRWENRFPIGKEGKWGDVTGPSKMPPPPYGSPGFITTEGVLQPFLGFGYNHTMEIWGNAAYDSARGKVVVPFHRLGQTYEYDPKARTWQHLESAAKAPYTFWDDLVFGAMGYDPVNKEVLAGQCRWALRDGKWTQLQFGSDLVNGLRGKAEALALGNRKLVTACRARFYLTESETMAKAQLDEAAAALAKEVGALAAELAASAGKAGEYEKKQFGWAGDSLKKAVESLGKAQGLLKGKVTPETIAAAEDGWEALDDAVEDLAVVPPKRAYCRPAADEKRGKLLVFGGYRLDRQVADTWVYDCKTRSWEQRRPKLSPAPRYGHGLVWLPTSGKFLLVDGAGKAESWIYDLDADEWQLLDDGGARRESLTTGASTWGWQPEMSAAAPGDVVITLANRNESRIPRFSTWAARVDVTKVDAEGTKKKGVPFRTEAFDGRTTDPRWYDQGAGTVDAAAQQEWLDKLQPNVWATRDRKQQKNNPDDNRAWGTSVFDPDRDQILMWGGGHVAYVGNAVLHYSVKTNQFYIGHRPEQALMYAHGQGGMKIAVSYRNRAFMTGHSYHSYAYDQPSGKMIVCGQSLAENTVKASLYFCYDPAAGEWFPNPIPTPFEAHYGFDRLCPTPRGAVAWASGALWKPDPAGLKWDKLPLSGAKLPGPSHEGHGLAHDAKRDRLLLFGQGGEVLAYDYKTGQASPLGPAGGKAAAFKSVRFRELVYMPEHDAVLVASRIPDADGKMRWPLYDCDKNAWQAVLLGGTEPTGKDYNVGLGLMHDAKRKLVWAADHAANISALRLDLKTADVRPLEDAAPAGGGK